MLILATGAISRPNEIAALAEEETRVLNHLRGSGLVLSAYRYKEHPGVISVLDAPSIDEAQLMMDALPFVAHGIMTFEYSELLEL
jgi:uncharacterized protein YciI